MANANPESPDTDSLDADFWSNFWSTHGLPIALACGILLLAFTVSFFANDDIASVLRWVSLGSLVVFFGSIGFSKLTAVLARNILDAIFFLFKPGLLMTQIAATALVLLTATAAVMTLYPVEALTIQSLHVVVMLFAVLAALNAAVRVGARLAGKNNMCSALLRADAYDIVWNITEGEMRKSLKEGKALISASWFSATVQEIDSTKLVAGLGDKKLSHPIDTHPPLAQRQESLDSSFERATQCDLSLIPVRLASLIIDRVGELEEKLSELGHWRFKHEQEGEKK